MMGMEQSEKRRPNFRGLRSSTRLKSGARGRGALASGRSGGGGGTALAPWRCMAVAVCPGADLGAAGERRDSGAPALDERVSSESSTVKRRPPFTMPFTHRTTLSSRSIPSTIVVDPSHPPGFRPPSTDATELSLRGERQPRPRRAASIAHAVEEQVGREGLVLVARDPRLVVSSG